MIYSDLLPLDSLRHANESAKDKGKVVCSDFNEFQQIKLAFSPGARDDTESALLLIWTRFYEYQHGFVLGQTKIKFA